LVINRIRDTFDYPIHFHPEMELNFIANGKGMKRTVGYSSEDIDDYELVLVGPNVYHGWEVHNCDHAVHEVTIQFHNDLFSPSLLRRSLMRPLKENYHKKITLDEVAELLNMSKVSFNRFMKKTSRQTFIEYVNEVRIDNAARLLAAMDYSISEIAFKCGFNNIANFNRIFKKTKKLTPSAYRKKFYNFKQIQ